MVIDKKDNGQDLLLKTTKARTFCLTRIFLMTINVINEKFNKEEVEDSGISMRVEALEMV